MDHSDLVRELPSIERMTNQERLKLAHSRRKLQLKVWAQNEKVWATGSVPHVKGIHPKGHPTNANAKHPSPPPAPEHVPPPKTKTDKGRIRFRNSIMLLEAAGRSDVDEVRRLLESGVDADVANEDGLTALHQCCIDDNEELLTLLLEFGANVNSEDSEKWTPLHAAATCGHLHLVKQLIAQGANLLAVNAEGNMPYDICDEEGTLDHIESEMAKRGVTQDLIEDIRTQPETLMLKDMQSMAAEDGDLVERDPDGATFLHIASANGYVRVVEFLLDNHVPTDAQDKDCWQPVHAAACWGHIDVLELLVQSGADLNARTKNNETPYAICEDPEMKERIIQLRSELESKLREGGVKKIRRSQSSNSRTQSIRRTSQRDKGLATKKDVADEAQMLLTISQINTKDSSPSPTSDVLIPITPDPEHSTTEGSDDEMEGAVRSLPPSLAFGRDSITQLEKKEELRSPTSKTNRFLSNHNNNLISSSPPESLQSLYQNPIGAIPVTHGMRMDPAPQLPTPDIHPTPNPSLQVQPINKGGGGVSVSGGTEGMGERIDIHVQVTINTNNTTPPTTYTPPGTLADLKKQRSLSYTSHSRSNSFHNNPLGMSELPPKYELPSNPTPSLKRFTGNPGDIVGDYSSNGKKCCVIT